MKALAIKTPATEVRLDSVTSRKLNKLRLVRANLATMKAIETGLVKDIKAFLGDSEILVDTDDKTVVTYKTETATKFDTTRLKKERPDVYKAFAKKKKGRKFVVVKAAKKETR